VTNVLQTLFTALLVLVALAIAGSAAVVVRRLYRGQD
jgi:hypothetical protein